VVALGSTATNAPPAQDPPSYKIASAGSDGSQDSLRHEGFSILIDFDPDQIAAQEFILGARSYDLTGLVAQMLNEQRQPVDDVLAGFKLARLNSRPDAQEFGDAAEPLSRDDE